jgi:hypothetical protein
MLTNQPEQKEEEAKPSAVTVSEQLEQALTARDAAKKDGKNVKTPEETEKKGCSSFSEERYGSKESAILQRFHPQASSQCKCHFEG